MTLPIAPSFCSRCGSQVNAGARFCTVCGNDVSGQQASLATQLVKTAPAPRPVGDVWAEQLELLRDATTGEYEILGELGRGGMAAVYLAHEFALERKVAIKVMSPALVAGDGMIERFKREARTAASLSHPHIIPVYAVRESDHLLYFVMKFIAGRPLDGVLKELGPLPIPMIQMVLQQVGGAFGYAHRRGIIHRDIKPANIMIDEEGWAVVTDFGIAKVSQAEGLTMTGMTVGTPTYMSPEQCMAQDVTGASDQYSLGVVAYEMITGRPPFAGGSMMAIMYGHFNDPPPPIDQARPECPEELKSAVMRMLEKDPANRWPSLEDAVEAIGEPPPKSDDAMRTQLVEIAKKSENTKLLKRLSTPISPTPFVKGRAKPTATVPAPGAPVTPRSVPARPPVVSSPAPAPKNKGVLIGAVAGIVVAGAALGLWRPWESRGAALTAAPVASATADTSGPAPTPVSNIVVDSTPQQQAAADTAQAAGPSPDTAGPPPPAPAAQPPAETAAQRRSKAEFQRRLDDFRQARQRAVGAGATELQLGPGDDFRKLADRQSATGDWKSALLALNDAIESFNTAESAARDRAQLAAAQARAQAQRPPVTQPESTPQRAAPAQQQVAPPPAPVAVDERPSVELAIREYARALSASDLPAMLAVFPTMPSQIRSSYEEMFKRKFSLDTSHWKYLEITVNGRSASARLGGKSVVRDNRGKPKSEAEFPRQASLEKSPTGGWRLTSIE